MPKKTPTAGAEQPADQILEALHGRLERALATFKEESATLVHLLGRHAVAKERYQQRWAALWNGGHIRGRNDLERKANEAHLLRKERVREQARYLRVRQAEIYREASLQELQTLRVLAEMAIRKESLGDQEES